MAGGGSDEGPGGVRQSAGATAGIADRIAARLRTAGLEADSVPVARVTDPGADDAFVVGAAAYMFHWLDGATHFVQDNRALLASRPTWLFSSGPLGTDLVDAKGRDVMETSVPREFPRLREAVHPRGDAIFFGAYDPSAKPIGLAERFTRLTPAAREGIPAGDFRDWPAIEAWADEIAAELGARPADPPVDASTGGSAEAPADQPA